MSSSQIQIQTLCRSLWNLLLDNLSSRVPLQVQSWFPTSFGSSILKTIHHSSGLPHRHPLYCYLSLFVRPSPPCLPSPCSPARPRTPLARETQESTPSPANHRDQDSSYLLRISLLPEHSKHSSFSTISSYYLPLTSPFIFTTVRSWCPHPVVPPETTNLV